MSSQQATGYRLMLLTYVMPNISSFYPVIIDLTWSRWYFISSEVPGGPSPTVYAICLPSGPWCVVSESDKAQTVDMT